MIGNRKEEGRVCTVLLHIIRKSPSPSENRLTAFQNWKKPKSVGGFEPVLPRQNAIAIPHVPPPLPSPSNDFNWIRVLEKRTQLGFPRLQVCHCRDVSLEVYIPARRRLSLRSGSCSVHAKSQSTRDVDIKSNAASYTNGWRRWKSPGHQS